MINVFDFAWNYRIVNTKSKNGGEDWYCIQEVTYYDGKPDGYGDPCLGSEDMETFGDVWHMMQEAVKLPPLQEEDFALSDYPLGEQDE
jgi:hypothetical protein